jgi:hypothetical protein
MVPYFGDFPANAKVYIPINTFDSNDPAASVTVTNLVNTDVHIHKDGGTTQRNNAAGITMAIDYDSITGNHLLTIDTSDTTVADFWQAGHEYQVRVEGITVDGGTINAWVGAFSIERSGGALALIKSATYGLSALKTLLDTTGIKVASFADNAITAASINADAITNAKIADNAIAAENLAADCITSAKIADNAFANEHFADGALTSTEITSAAGCIVASIANNAITANAINNDAITAAKIANGAIDAATFAANAITSTVIADDAITAAKINTGAFTADAFAADAIVAATLATGCLTADAFAADAIVAATLATDCITDDAIATGAITAAAIATDAIDADALKTDALAEIADAVWDEDSTGHTDAGKAGAQLWTVLDDVPNTSEFQARTIAAADYTVVSDLGTVQTGDAFGALASIDAKVDLVEDIVRNKMEITDANGNLVLYEDDGTTPKYSVSACVVDNSTTTTRKRLE